ncbi:hypothetical protein [Sphingomonas sp. PAMC 26605]|uniref:hypothetical protein n=1 Tax=Sphingomonas sp. PAMC 26605 TaxID=1112214 RepID=UPI00026CD178|nr:hypothetical protein [Sphingomonas sp. PAMC 26605]
MREITIEAFGGFVGAGGPGSHVHQRGKIAWSALSSADQAALERLFAARAKVNANLYYRLTRTGDGATETVDALPDQVPAALLASVQSTLD